MGLATARAGNVIGGGDWAPDRLIPDIMRNILNKKIIKIRNPQSTRPWQFVLEPLTGYLKLIEKLWENGPKFSDAWNFGPSDDDAKPVIWIVEKLQKLWKDEIHYKIDSSDYPPEAKYLKLDCSKAKTELEWHPKTNLEWTLKQITEWYENYDAKMNVRQFTLNQIEEFLSLKS